MRFSTILTALFCPYIAHERTAQNLILSVRSSLFALFLKSLIRSQNQGSLKREERLSDFKERCAHLCNTHLLSLIVFLYSFTQTSPLNKKSFSKQAVVYNLYNCKMTADFCFPNSSYFTPSVVYMERQIIPAWKLSCGLKSNSAHGSLKGPEKYVVYGKNLGKNSVTTVFMSL